MSNGALKQVAGVIASLSPLYNPGHGSWWNPEARDDNCVWVSIARFFNLTVPELTAEVGKQAPNGGATQDEIYDFLEAVSAWSRGLVVVGGGDFEQLLCLEGKWKVSLLST